MPDTISDEYLQNLIAAVEDEGAEAKAFSNSYALGKGVRIPTASQRPLYTFSLINPPRLQEEARGRLVVRGMSVECTVISRRSDGLDVATFVDLGDELESATLTVDRSEILSIVAARLESVRGGSSAFSWNNALAAQVINVSRIEPNVNDDFLSAPDDLTSDQQEAFRRAIRNRVTYLWGPPGTGKTVTLSAIAFHLFCHNKRVLLVSHTNRAVDGITLQLCKRIVGKARASIPEGSVVRVGSISRSGLASAFGAQVGLDTLAEAHQRKVRERIATVRKERELNAKELEGLRHQYALTARRTVLEEELSKLQAMLAEAKGSESGLTAVLRVLRIQYGVGDGKGGSIGDIKRSIKSVTSEILEVASQLEQVTSPEDLHDQIRDAEKRDVDLTESIGDLEALCEDPSSGTISRARVVACTATQALLRCSSLGEFDVVVVDEASMLPLPYVVLLSGLAREKVVIGGDFRQLPPISLSSSPMAQQWFARDIFEAAGVVDLVDRGEESPFLATLTTQFRGHETLSALINERFYGGRLVPKNKAPSASEHKHEATKEAVLRAPVLIVDTSFLKPVGHVVNRSKVNVAQGLVVREVCLALRRAGLLSTVHDVGVIAPYRPQVSLIEDLLDEAQMSEIAVGTAHRFQGAERETIVLDLTESEPHRVGTFLGPTSLRDVGAKLLNVSLSRAQHRLVVVANMSYLREQLTDRHILLGIIEDIARLGAVIDARGLIPDAISDAGSVCGERLGSQRFDSETFLAGFTADVRECESSLSISSARVSSRAAHVISTIARPLVDKGVRVEVVCPADAIGGENDDAREAKSIIEGAGIAVRMTLERLHDAVVVDRQILWMGNTPPLDCIDTTDLIMTRTVSPIAAEAICAVVFGDGHAARDLPHAANG